MFVVYVCMYKEKPTKKETNIVRRTVYCCLFPLFFLLSRMPFEPKRRKRATQQTSRLACLRRARPRLGRQRAADRPLPKAHCVFWCLSLFSLLFCARMAQTFFQTHGITERVGDRQQRERATATVGIFSDGHTKSISLVFFVDVDAGRTSFAVGRPRWLGPARLPPPAHHKKAKEKRNEHGQIHAKKPLTNQPRLPNACAHAKKAWG